MRVYALRSIPTIEILNIPCRRRTLSSYSSTILSILTGVIRMEMFQRGCSISVMHRVTKPIDMSSKKNVPAKVIGIQLLPDYYETYLKKEFGMKDIDLKKDLQVFPHGVVIPEIAAIFSKIRSFNGTELSTRLFFKSKIDELTAILIQKAEEFRLPENRKIIASDRRTVIRITEYVNTHLSKNFLLPELAAEAYMSVWKFKYVFKAVTGQTFSDYIRQKKIEKACELLTQSNLYVAEIAYRLGYKNAGSFSVQFKEYTGVLPSDYRILGIKY